VVFISAPPVPRERCGALSRHKQPVGRQFKENILAPLRTGRRQAGSSESVSKPYRRASMEAAALLRGTGLEIDHRENK